MDNTGTHFHKKCIVQVVDEKDGKVKDKEVTIVGTTRREFCQNCDKVNICFSSANSLNSYNNDIIYCVNHLPIHTKCHVCDPTIEYNFNIDNISKNYIHICQKCFGTMILCHEELFSTCKYPVPKYPHNMCGCKFC